LWWTPTGGGGGGRGTFPPLLLGIFSLEV
jgi:hypothetical protein